METITVSKTYKIQHWISDIICITQCGKVINSKLGKELKQFMIADKKYVYINRVPVKVEDLKPLERIICPF